MKESEYVPRDDESEAKRVKDLNGYGEEIYLTDEQVGSYSMADYGFGLEEELGRSS